jgi:hypothetical protein
VDRSCVRRKCERIAVTVVTDAHRNGLAVQPPRRAGPTAPQRTCRSGGASTGLLSASRRCVGNGRNERLRSHRSSAAAALAARKVARRLARILRRNDLSRANFDSDGRRSPLRVERLFSTAVSARGPSGPLPARRPALALGATAGHAARGGRLFLRWRASPSPRPCGGSERTGGGAAPRKGKGAAATRHPTEQRRLLPRRPLLRRRARPGSRHDPTGRAGGGRSTAGSDFGGRARSR